jgi:hypothetical protein
MPRPYAQIIEEYARQFLALGGGTPSDEQWVVMYRKTCAVIQKRYSAATLENPEYTDLPTVLQCIEDSGWVSERKRLLLQISAIKNLPKDYIENVLKDLRLPERDEDLRVPAPAPSTAAETRASMNQAGKKPWELAVGRIVMTWLLSMTAVSNQASAIRRLVAPLINQRGGPRDKTSQGGFTTSARTQRRDTGKSGRLFLVLRDALLALHMLEPRMFVLWIDDFTRGYAGGRFRTGGDLIHMHMWLVFGLKLSLAAAVRVDPNTPLVNPRGLDVPSVERAVYDEFLTAHLCLSTLRRNSPGVLTMQRRCLILFGARS